MVVKKHTIKKLSQKRLKEVLCYNKKTGAWTWNIYRNSFVNKGSVAGSIHKQRGHRYICIDGNRFLSGRLAFLYVKGYLPENDVHHKNEIKHDDRWTNLDHLTRPCHARKRNILKNNTSGINGVCWDKKSNKWVAYIKVMYKRINLGRYSNLKAAANARWLAEKKYGFSKCKTDSSAYLYLHTDYSSLSKQERNVHEQ